MSGASFRMHHAETAIRLSEEKARLLTRVGMPVRVRDDFNKYHQTVTESEPWQLGHGAWVVNLAPVNGKKFRCYDCGRVTPIVSEVKS